MKVIGLVGGVASGKSLVADCFARLSLEVLDADQAVHEILRHAEVIAAARRRWGDRILDAEGQINRQALARIVFTATQQGEQERAELERLIHPRVRQQFTRRIDELSQAGDCPAVVIDAPLLLEAGWGPICDTVVFVHAHRADRLARARARGWTEDEFAARESAQMSVDEKRAAADTVIDNSGSPDQTYGLVEACWQRFRCH